MTYTPENPLIVHSDIGDYMSRYGRLRLVRRDDGALALESDDAALLAQVWHNKQCHAFLDKQIDAHTLLVRPASRGHIKQALVHLGFPAEDLAGYVEGEALPVEARPITVGGRPFGLRDYQQASVDAFYAGGSSHG